MKTSLFKKILIAASVAAISLPSFICFSACEDKTLQDGESNQTFLLSYDDVTDYVKDCEEQGSWEYFTYEAHSYVLESLPENRGKEIILTKTAQVYLPYGYDPEGEYDVLYLLHGTGTERERYWLELHPDTLKVLDNMIYSGICNPTIVVCPNYYSIPDGYEDYENLIISEDPNADLWPMYFYMELRNELIPAIESHYATYAHGDVTLENLQATREHRAFAGLSRGSMTVVNSGMIHCTDLFAYFGSFSGIWADFNEFENALNGEFDEYGIKYWYNGTGTLDNIGDPPARENQQEFTSQVLENMPDKFTDGENFALIVLIDGQHNYYAWIVDLFNCLLVFFK